MIKFHAIDVEMPLLDVDEVRAWITQVVEDAGYRVGELYYYFCSDGTLLQINKERLGHDFYTDIVTFPLRLEDGVISSEFCISVDRIADNALRLGRSFEEELHRVIIHGILHLCGINDKGPGEREMMEAAENKALAMR